MAGQYAYLQSSAIVRLYGITLSSNVSLVLEYFRLGPLDQYLRNNKGILKKVDLIEAASNVASALWHLVSFMDFCASIGLICLIVERKWNCPWKYKMQEANGELS